MKSFSALSLVGAIFTTAVSMSAANAAADADAAQAYLKKEKCTKCHSADKAKSGPSYKSIAAKFKGQADAESKLVTHITTGPMVEMDGAKEAHPKPKNTGAADVKNVAQYILSH